MSTVFPDVAAVRKTLDFEAEFCPEGNHTADQERADLLQAERACYRLLVMCECGEFGPLAMRRVDAYLRAIRRALEANRTKLGLQSAKADEVAA